MEHEIRRGVDDIEGLQIRWPAARRSHGYREDEGGLLVQGLGGAVGGRPALAVPGVEGLPHPVRGTLGTDQHDDRVAQVSPQRRIEAAGKSEVATDAGGPGGYRARDSWEGEPASPARAPGTPMEPPSPARASRLSLAATCGAGRTRNTAAAARDHRGQHDPSRSAPGVPRHSPTPTSRSDPRRCSPPTPPRRSRSPGRSPARRRLPSGRPMRRERTSGRGARERGRSARPGPIPRSTVRGSSTDVMSRRRGTHRVDEPDGHPDCRRRRRRSSPTPAGCAG